MRVLVAALLLVPLLAGCLVSDEDDPAWQPPAVLYATSEGRLIDRPPVEGMVDLPWDCNDYQNNVAPPEWRGPTFARDIVIDVATLHAHYQVGPATQCFPRNEFTTWFGTVDAFGTHPQLDGPDLLTGVEQHQPVFEYKLPPGGLVLPAGDQLAVRIAAYYTGTNPNQLLLGAEATRLELGAKPIRLPATAVRQTHEFEGEVQGILCTSATAARGMVGTASFEFEVEPTDRFVEVALASTGGRAGDLDIVLYDGAGEPVWGGHGSMPEETVKLYAPNLDATAPGAWTAHVYTCTGTSTTATVAIRIEA